MSHRIAGLFSIIKREARIITKDLNIIAIILLAPLFYATFYTSTYVKKGETDTPIAVMDLDRSNYSEEFIRKLDADQMLHVDDIITNTNSIKEHIYKDHDQAVIVIPENFEKSLKSGRSVTIKMYLNTVRFLVSNDINKAVNEVVFHYHKKIRMKMLEISGYSSKQAKGMQEPLNLDVRNLFNPAETYGDFLIPGILIIILQQTLLIGLSESVAREREKNSLGELFEEANRSTSAALFGKGSFYFLFFVSYAIFYFTILFPLFKINFKGSFILMMCITALFIAATIAGAIFFSSFFKRKIIALQVIAFTTFPLFFLSGYVWPLSAMPAFLQYISVILPTTPYFKSYVAITQMGAGLNDVIPFVWHLILIMIFWMVITYFRMKSIFRKMKFEEKTF
jgi:ABC-2 type transport system permease protein